MRNVEYYCSVEGSLSNDSGVNRRKQDARGIFHQFQGTESENKNVKNIQHEMLEYTC